MNQAKSQDARTQIAFRQRLDTYLSDERTQGVKYIFKLLESLLEGSEICPSGIDKYTAWRLLDLGCATGGLVSYLAQQYPKMKAVGLDNSPELIAGAHECGASDRTELVLADALSYRDGPFDVITCFGMLGVFNCFEPLFENMLANAAPGSRIFVQALFNPDDIDVRISYRDNMNGVDWNGGFNIFAQARVAMWLTERCSAWRFHQFLMPVEIEKRESLPHRAYTKRMSDNSLMTVNGLCLTLPEHLLEIIV